MASSSAPPPDRPPSREVDALAVLDRHHRTGAGTLPRLARIGPKRRKRGGCGYGQGKGARCPLQVSLDNPRHSAITLGECRPCTKSSVKSSCLAIPIVIGQVSQMLMGLTDSVMIGRVGTIPLAASSFGGGVFNIFFIVGVGLLTPVAIFASRSHGADNPKRRRVPSARPCARGGGEPA